MPDRFEETRRVWKERFDAWQSSGQKITHWCREQQVDYKAFLYWKKRFSPAALKLSSFLELTEPKHCMIKIEYQDVRISLESGSLKQCLAVLAELRC